jgi:hypothetical protein
MISSFSSKQRSSRSAVAIVTVVCIALLVVAVALVIGGCGGGKAGLVGKWYSATEAETVEFMADGKMIVTGDDASVLEMTYTTKDGQLTVTVMGQTATTSYTLDGDTLTVTDLDTQQPATYERVK